MQLSRRKHPNLELVRFWNVLPLKWCPKFGYTWFHVTSHNQNASTLKYFTKLSVNHVYYTHTHIWRLNWFSVWTQIPAPGFILFCIFKCLKSSLTFKAFWSQAFQMRETWSVPTKKTKVLELRDGYRKEEMDLLFNFNLIPFTSATVCPKRNTI